SSGTLQVTGGSSMVAQYVMTDVAGAVFAQSGGTVNVAGPLYTGYLNQGLCNLGGGLLSIGNGSEYLGFFNTSSGTLVQSGGTNATTGTVYLGFNNGANGLYSLSGGSLAASNEYVGDNGGGSVAQTGGSNSVTTGSLYLAYLSIA